MISKTKQKMKENNSMCMDDIDCKNKRCSKLHNERKRLNICKFDVFFVPYKDDGCHFEDCTHNHPKRNSFYIQKEKDFDDLIKSVIDVLGLDDDIPVTNDWKKLINNVYYDEYNKLYEELYNYCVNINQLSYQLEALQFYDPQSYVYYLQNILSKIYMNHQSFNLLLKRMLLRYDEHKNDYEFLCKKLYEDIQYVTMYKENAQKILYQQYGVNIIF